MTSHILDSLFHAFVTEIPYPAINSDVINKRHTLGFNEVVNYNRKGLCLKPAIWDQSIQS